MQQTGLKVTQKYAWLGETGDLLGIVQEIKI